MEAPCLITALKTQSVIRFDKNICSGNKADIPEQVIEYDGSRRLMKIYLRQTCFSTVFFTLSSGELRKQKRVPYSETALHFQRHTRIRNLFSNFGCSVLAETHFAPAD